MLIYLVSLRIYFHQQEEMLSNLNHFGSQLQFYRIHVSLVLLLQLTNIIDICITLLYFFAC